MSQLIKISGDLYGISERLKEIDERYELFFNAKRNRYEIYIGGALQLAAPFDRLDCRMLDYALKTRIANREKLILEVERDNKRLDKQKRAEIIDKALAATKL